MANLFPSIFPYSPDSDEMKKLGIQTEFKIYEKLGSIFDETVDVLYGPKFIKRIHGGNIGGGEYADFIILHPTKGIIFLECKGGLVTYNSKTGEWLQENKPLKDPINKAEKGKYNFIKLFQFPYYKNKIDISSIPTIHGVIFPDTPKEHRVNLGQKIKPEMIIWGEDVIDLEKSLTKMFNLNRGEYQLKEEEKQLIRKTLYGIDLKSPFKKYLSLVNFCKI